MAFPATVRRLLACGFGLSVARALVSPLLVLTLGRQLALGPRDIGLLLGGVLLLATLGSLYAGYLVDRLAPRRLLLAALLLMAAGFALLPFCRQPLAAAGALLLTESALVLFGITLKALLAALLPPAERSRAFSLRYTLANVGYATGPLLASLVAATQAALAFWLAAALVLACLPLLRGLPTGRLAAASATPAPDFSATLHLLRRDRTLILFTIGSLLACVVQARFSDYLALYLLQTLSDAEVLRWMSVLITTNSLTVVLLQYPLGKLLRPHTLLRWIMASSLLLAAGLAGCALSDSLWAWAGWMVVFTLGEILLVPAEYLYIDAIAPEHLRGSYYGAQNLAQAGGAISPVLAGMVLLRWPPDALLVVMMALSLLGAGFVWLAHRQRQPAA